MNKLKIALFSVGVMFLAFGHAHSYTKEQHKLDIVTYNFKGSTNTAVAISSTGRLNMTDGIVNIVDRIGKPIFTGMITPGAVDTGTASFITATVSTFAYISQSISTTVLSAQGTTYITSKNGDFRQSVFYPYALTFALWSQLSNATHTFITTATIVGVSSIGEDIRERVRVTSTPAVSKYGYIKITSITYSATVAMATSPTVSTMYLVVGTTATYGLSNDIEQSSDVFKVNSYGVDFSSYSVNSDFNTIKLTVSPQSPPPPDGLDIWFKAVTSPPNRRR